ncbi:hypothetical protein LINPERPRIM_LOCUS32283 [Linum perenne]
MGPPRFRCATLICWLFITIQYTCSITISPAFPIKVSFALEIEAIN